MTRMRHFLRTCLFFALIFIFPSNAALAQEGAVAFSWGITASLLDRTVGLFSPPQVSEIFVLADQPHIFSGKMTYVYYWPLDREYKADWSQLNQDVAGVLEIYDTQGKKIQTLEREWYLFQQDNNSDQLSYQLVTGPQALAAYQDYETRRDQYFSAMEQYDKELGKYLDQLAQPGDQPLEEPEKPAPFTEIMQQPELAFILNLPPGRYSIRMLDQNMAIVPGSQRTLVSVAPRRESVGLVVFPEARWTKPEASYESRDVIYYTKTDLALYMQPVKILEFNEREYTRLSKPQETVSSSKRWIWIQDEKLSGFDLEVLIGERSYAQLAQEEFSVVQNPGFALGYQISPYRSELSSRPDFSAYRILLNTEISRYTIRLINQHGEVVQNSERAVLRAASNMPGWAIIFLFLPVFIGAGLKTLQFRKKRNAKALSQHDEI